MSSVASLFKEFQLLRKRNLNMLMMIHAKLPNLAETDNVIS